MFAEDPPAMMALARLSMVWVSACWPTPKMIAQATKAVPDLSLIHIYRPRIAP